MVSDSFLLTLVNSFKGEPETGMKMSPSRSTFSRFSFVSNRRVFYFLPPKKFFTWPKWAGCYRSGTEYVGATHTHTHAETLVRLKLKRSFRLSSFTNDYFFSLFLSFLSGFLLLFRTRTLLRFFPFFSASPQFPRSCSANRVLRHTVKRCNLRLFYFSFSCHRFILFSFSLLVPRFCYML